VDKILQYITHGQCDARPMVTFSAVGHCHPLTGINLYRLWTEACVCLNCHLKAQWPRVE